MNSASWRLLPAPGLLLVDNPLVDFRDCRHPPAHHGHKIGRQIAVAVFPRSVTLHGALQNQGVGVGGRQAVGLLSLPQLQPVLQMAQEFVGAGQVMKFLAADVALVV